MRRGGLLLVLLALIAGGGLITGFVALGGTERLRTQATASADPCTAPVPACMPRSATNGRIKSSAAAPATSASRR